MKTRSMPVINIVAPMCASGLQAQVPRQLFRKNNPLAFLTSLLCLAFILIASPTLAAAPMTNADVIKMVQAGIDESVIITSIQSAESKFDTSADGLIALTQANVSKPVINAIVTQATSAPASRAATPEATTIDPTRRTRVYINLTPAWSFPSQSGAKTGFGFGTAFGVAIKGRSHIETELLYLKYKYNSYYSSTNVTWMPVLATYRYAFIFGDSRLGLQIGGSLGISQSKSSYSYYSSYSGYYYSYSDTSTDAVFGPQALLTCRLGGKGGKLSLYTGTKFLWTTDSDSSFTTIFVIGATLRF